MEVVTVGRIAVELCLGMLPTRHLPTFKPGAPLDIGPANYYAKFYIHPPPYRGAAASTFSIRQADFRTRLGAKLCHQHLVL